MPNSIALSLPPLRRKIVKGFFLVVALYGVLGVFILTAVFLASGITPKVMHVNYDSIAAALQMREALTALRRPADFPGKSLPEWETQFEKALEFEEGNVTEPGEDTIAHDLRVAWNQIKNEPTKIASEPSSAIFRKLDHLLASLIQINQAAMFTIAEESVVFRDRVFLVAGLVFLITILVALYVADGLANRLASPIKAIAEALRNKPVPGEKLKLPPPNSLEIRILTHEMTQLWKRLSELRLLNIEEIAAQRSKLEIVLEAVEDGILVVDNADVVLQCNQGLLSILGLSSDLVIGHRWHDLATAFDDYLTLRDRLSPAMAENEQVELKVNGEARTFGCRHRNILTKEGQVAATLFLLHDITERKQKDRLKSEFIAVLSHELKTPLQSLGTAAELLMKRKVTMGDEEKMLIETVSEDVARIRAVAEDFIQVTFIDPHALRLKTSKHPISELIQEWITPFKLVARDKKVRVTFQKEGSEVMWANVDAVKFPWAISNLLSNAIRFSPADSEVTISISDKHRNIVIEIRDEGPGIPEEMQKKMFDPYFQGPVTLTSVPSGFLGLGLTIAKEVVEAHKGTIEYHPGNPRGSNFRITLPPLADEEVSEGVSS